MQDSYGDGWNGASIDVSVNGTFVANWGLATGSAGFDSIATLSGDIVEFTFNDGWAQETNDDFGIVNYSIATNDSLVVCDSAIWNGNTYNTTGIYIDTLQTNLVLLKYMYIAIKY